MKRVAFVVGYERLGGVPHFAKLFSQYGFENVIGLVDQPDLLQHGIPNLTLVKVGDPLDPAQLLKAARDCGANRESPFFCVQDRLTFSYLDALQELDVLENFHVPVEGIRRARLKPVARELWNRAGVDLTKWTIRCESAKRSDAWNAIGGLSSLEGGRQYIVKPIAGMASEAVAACSAKEVVQRVDDVRAFLRAQTYFRPMGTPGSSVECDLGHRKDTYYPYSDVLVEEFIDGDEFTIDGSISESGAAIAVQQKEFRVVKPFFGDGLIVSPPDVRAIGRSDDLGDSMLQAGQCLTDQASFASFLERGARALGLCDWVFHAEVIQLGRNALRFVELNPRPAGGLLWHTAGMHLGLDALESVVRMHLKIHTPTLKRGWITGQFPIYAQKVGVVLRVEGLEDAEACPGVQRVVPVLRAGDRVVSLDKENYVAFVSIYAESHQAVRQIAEKVRRMIQVHIDGSSPEC